MRVAVVIPIKSFTMAKGRLSSALTPTEREALARECAATVIRAARPDPVFVACSDPEVADWAREHGADVIDCATPGLDAAVRFASAHLREAGYDHMVVAHGDLPLASRFTHLVRPGRVTLVGDRHRDGTNVLCFPLDRDFTTAYGPGSLDNHVAIAIESGLDHEVIIDDDLALDLDTIEDLDELRRRKETR